MHLNTLKKSPVFFGIAVALAAVALQVAFKDELPLAYGICTVCHARDLFSWIANHLGNFQMDSPGFASQALVLTPVGLVAGSFVASKRSSEFKIGHPSHPVLMFLCGVLVSMIGLLIMSCPTRIVLRTAFGDTFGLLAAGGSSRHRARGAGHEDEAIAWQSSFPWRFSIGFLAGFLGQNSRMCFVGITGLRSRSRHRPPGGPDGFFRHRLWLAVLLLRVTGVLVPHYPAFKEAVFSNYRNRVHHWRVADRLRLDAFWRMPSSPSRPARTREAGFGHILPGVLHRDIHLFRVIVFLIKGLF